MSSRFPAHSYAVHAIRAAIVAAAAMLLLLCLPITADAHHAFPIAPRVKKSAAFKTVAQHQRSFDARAPRRQRSTQGQNGTLKTLFITFVPPGATSTLPQSQVEALSASTNSWLKATSYQRARLSATFVEIPISEPTDSPTGIDGIDCQIRTQAMMFEARSKLDAKGYATASFDRIIGMYTSLSVCKDWGGYTTPYAPANQHIYILPRSIKGSASALQAAVRHELAHTYNMFHASALTCSNYQGLPSFIVGRTIDQAATKCAYSEYGNPFDVLGRGNFSSLSAPMRAQAGWLLPESIGEAGAGMQRFQLVSVNRSQGLRAVRFDVPQMQSSAPGYSRRRQFWVEYREMSAFDATMPINNRGVLINDAAVDLMESGEHTIWPRLIDGTPGTNEGHNDAAFVAGSVFVDPGSGFTVRVISVQDGIATVEAGVPAAGEASEPTAVTRFEGESLLGIGTNGLTKRVRDTGAHNGVAGVLLRTNDQSPTSFQVKAGRVPTSINVRARSTKCLSSDSLIRFTYESYDQTGQLRSNSRYIRVPASAATDHTYRDYAVPVSGIYSRIVTVKVAFMNDSSTSTCDQNVFIDYFDIAWRG